MIAFAFAPSGQDRLVYVRYAERDTDRDGGGLNHWEGWTVSKDHAPGVDDEYMFDKDGNVWLLQAEDFSVMVPKRIVGTLAEVILSNGQILYADYEIDRIAEHRDPHNHYNLFRVIAN